MWFMMCVAILACLMAWVAKLAEARGRIALGWAAASAVVGVAGFLFGLALVGLAVTDEESDSLALIAAFMPTVLMVGSVIALAAVLQRLPLKTSSRLSWPIHEIVAGAEGLAGRLAIEQATLRFDLPSGPRIVPLTALRTAKADGECVRLSWDEGGEPRETMLLPCGKPDSPEGRRQQSRVIEQRLRERITAPS
jgi:hypothetical protein